MPVVFKGLWVSVWGSNKLYGGNAQGVCSLVCVFCSWLESSRSVEGCTWISITHLSILWNTFGLSTGVFVNLVKFFSLKSLHILFQNWLASTPFQKWCHARQPVNTYDVRLSSRQPSLDYQVVVNHHRTAILKEKLNVFFRNLCSIFKLHIYATVKRLNALRSQSAALTTLMLVSTITKQNPLLSASLRPLALYQLHRSSILKWQTAYYIPLSGLKMGRLSFWRFEVTFFWLQSTAEYVGIM